MKPSYHGAPLEKERKTSVFRSGSAKVSDSGKRPAELTPLLEAAARNARTTENVAGATLSALESQGEKLQSASGHVQGVKQVAEESNIHIRLLQQKVFNKRLCLWLIAALLCGAIVGLLVHHFFYHK